ncbi:3-propionate hydroxylase [Auricularia subglabra TFB-10046 SS5]|nr:3-propionate hydroxylase [Auricularia subglabra TFB-10046 SS5]
MASPGKTRNFAAVEFADVLIVGGGPVGQCLITAYQLGRTLPFPSTSIKVVEKRVRDDQDAYGRAITLFPRTTELLDQLGLADTLAQQCFACRETVSYDASGNEVLGRGWAFMEQMKDTIWDFSLVLRQKYLEEIFRTVLRKLGIVPESPTEFLDASVDTTASLGDYRVTATLRDMVTGATRCVKCKYLIGADGGRSTVRRVFDIPFDGSSSPDKWVRIDGVVKTNIPKPRSYCAIESPTHGNVLWVALDHGATRIGYAFTPEREAAYPVFDEAAAVKEALAAVKPFDVAFERVDWWTLYVVGQRVARTFSAHGCAFLAGDSCHTHSSGAAQGMNTGLHDAVNLGWKLSLVLRGLAPPALLETYERERRPNVERLIRFDKDIARLMTMQLPEGWTGDSAADPNVVLGEVMAQAASFSSGLGIFYDPDPTSVLDVEQSHLAPKSFAVHPGHRAPDVPLRKPGSLEATRLQRETPNLALFYVVVFAGDPSRTRANLHGFCAALDASSLLSPTLPIGFISISRIAGPSVYELLGGRMPPGGDGVRRLFFDTSDGVAHSRYGVDADEGAVYVLRPDGWVGTVLALGIDAVYGLEQYLGAIFTAQQLPA